MIRRDALDYWRQVTAAAPGGPWRVDVNRGAALMGSNGERVGDLASPEIAEFTAAARDAMPVLLAEHDHLVELVRSIANSQERHCPDCGPLDALGHRKRCRLAPYLR